MSTGAGRCDRLVRAAVFAGTSVSLGAAAHTAGGGMAPSLPVLVGAAFLLLRLGYGLTGVERGPWSVLGAVGLAQAALHAAFWLATPACMSGEGMGPPMLGAHAAAAVAVGMLLRRADAALWAAARVLTVAAGRRLLAAAQVVAAPVGCLPVPNPRPAMPLPAGRSALLVYACPRRGPPESPVPAR